MVGTEGWPHWGLRGSTRADVANVSRVRAALEEGASVGAGGVQTIAGKAEWPQ